MPGREVTGERALRSGRPDRPPSPHGHDNDARALVLGLPAGPSRTVEVSFAGQPAVPTARSVLPSRLRVSSRIEFRDLAGSCPRGVADRRSRARSGTSAPAYRRGQAVELQVREGGRAGTRSARLSTPTPPGASDCGTDSGSFYETDAQIRVSDEGCAGARLALQGARPIALPRGHRRRESVNLTQRGGSRCDARATTTIVAYAALFDRGRDWRRVRSRQGLFPGHPRWLDPQRRSEGRKAVFAVETFEPDALGWRRRSMSRTLDAGQFLQLAGYSDAVDCDPDCRDCPRVSPRRWNSPSQSRLFVVATGTQYTPASGHRRVRGAVPDTNRWG